MLLSTAIPLVVVLVSPVWAQLTVAQCPAGFDWNKNSLGQDPCTVGSILDASCRGLTEYTYPPLESTQYYLPPRANHSGDVMCDCNTVMYSLYMACASCQRGEIYSWAKWIPECASVYVSQYPANIPQGTAVPRWAYYDITSLPTQTWNESVVTNIGQQPEELLKRVDSVPPPVQTDPSPVSIPPPPVSIPPSPVSIPPPAMQGTSEPGKMTSIRDPAGQSNPTVPAVPTPNTPDSPEPTTPANSPDPTTPPGTTNPPEPPAPTNNPNPAVPTNTPNPVVPTDTPNPAVPNNTPNPAVPTDTTNSPNPAVPTGTTDSPNPAVPTDTTDTPNPAVPTDATNSPGPTTPISNTNLSGPTVSTGNTNSPNAANPTSNAKSPRPTTNPTSNTSSRQAANPFGTSTGLPAPANAGNMKTGTNVWTVVVFILAWALM